MPSIRDVLEEIYNRIEKRPDLQESEVTDVFTDNDFFGTLGYEGIPIDVRSENHIVGGDRPDYFAKDKLGNTVFVVEFKKPSRSESLAEHRGQLWNQYVVPLRAKYGVLTDGERMILYERRTGNHREQIFDKRLDEFSSIEIDELAKLEKPDYTFESTDEFESYFSTEDPVSVGELVDGEPVGRNEFLDTFRLERGTVFYEMLEQTYELLDFYLEQDVSGDDEGTFPQDAYEFWQSYYASDPGWYDLPEEWREIAGSASNKQKIMFAVETVQSILGRLMLAKACEDYDFPNVSISEHIQDETIDFRGQIPAIAHIHAGDKLMETMREELVESVFEQDIYYWWTQPAEDIDGMSSREILDEDWASEKEDFGRSFVEFTIAMARFDFSSIRGDPLGELYQQYFDPETRRALGEFYTPPSVCEYIVDSTGYGDNVQYRRLIDPACGSGTFLMTALEKYRQELEDDEYLPDALRELCNRGRIVGLDIHPFAVVLAQIRFMLGILEEYKSAIETEPDLVLRRLPIFRTDSLLDESQAEEGVQQTLGASYGEETVEFSMPLPIRREAEFESMDFEFPRFAYVQSATSGEISNQQQYFSALCAIFDAVKESAVDEVYTIDQDTLIPYFYDYFATERDIDIIASTFLDTANAFLETVRELREEYNDGRLLKLIEDVVLGATLKNDIEYDYVVGNPPWVAKQSRHSDDEEKRRMEQLYLSAWKETDPYLQFMERGMGILKEGGTIGFLVSNRFLTNQGGKEIRALLAKNEIRELIDFTDYQLFDDATNYSGLLVAEKQVPNDDWESFIQNDGFTNRYEISTTRVRDWNGTIPELVEQIRSREPTESVDFFSIDSTIFQERIHVRTGRVETEKVESTYRTSQGRITLTRNLPIADVWTVAPPDELEIVNEIETSMEMRLGDKTVIRNNEPENIPNLVGDDILVGIQTSGDGAYIVKPTTGIAKEELHELHQLTVRPRDIDKTYTVETDLLKIDITGEDADRWLPNWSNRLVFIPYIQADERAVLIRPTQLANELPKTWAYFTNTSVLKKLSEESNERRRVHVQLAKEFGIIGIDDSELSDTDYHELSNHLEENPSEVEQLDKELWWYRFMRRQNIESLPKPKVLTGDLVQYNKLSFDDSGIMAPHNVSVYAILLPEENKRVLAGILNSSTIEFYHKQHSRIHVGKAYRYIEDHTSQWPVIQPSGDRESDLEEYVDRILELRNLEIKIPQFPDPYIADSREVGEEFIPVSYTPSNDYTAEPTLQSDLADGYVIGLDDGSLTDNAIDTEVKARYVVEALNGIDFEANESVTVSVPMNTAIAESALEELSADRDRLASEDISDIETEIDEIVFELYGIESERHKEMIRRYNKQYENVQAIDPIDSE